MVADTGPLSGSDDWAPDGPTARRRAVALRTYAKQRHAVGDHEEAEWALGLACGWDNYAVWRESEPAA